MTKLIRATIMILAFSIPLLALAHKKRAPAAAPQHEIEAVVVYGEKKSTFQIDKKGPAYKLHFHNNFGEDKNTDVSVKNFEYLVSQLKGVQESAPDPERCQRMSITVTAAQKQGARSYFACLGARSEESRALGHFVDLMTLML